MKRRWDFSAHNTFCGMAEASYGLYGDSPFQQLVSDAKRYGYCLFTFSFTLTEEGGIKREDQAGVDDVLCLPILFTWVGDNPNSGNQVLFIIAEVV